MFDLRSRTELVFSLVNRQNGKITLWAQSHQVNTLVRFVDLHYQNSVLLLTSAAKVFPSTVCSDPALLSLPQCAWNCHSSYSASPNGPPFKAILEGPKLGYITPLGSINLIKSLLSWHGILIEHGNEGLIHYIHQVHPIIFLFFHSLFQKDRFGKPPSSFTFQLHCIGQRVINSMDACRSFSTLKALYVVAKIFFLIYGANDT